MWGLDMHHGWPKLQGPDVEDAALRRDAIEAGEAVEGTFSRNRSFGKKYKKYGQYVPRGQEGPRKE